MKKKLALVFAAAFVAFSLSACGGGEKQTADNNTQTPQNTATQQQGETDPPGALGQAPRHPH